MFIAKYNNIIIQAENTQEELLEKIQSQCKYYETIEETDLIYKLYRGEYLTEEEIKNKEKEQFLKEFFNTSLGYVRRKVSMQTGETKDFLADILPILQVGIPILTYTEDGEQNKVLVTEEFLDECKQQVIKDFYGT